MRLATLTTRLAILTVLLIALAGINLYAQTPGGCAGPPTNWTAESNIFNARQEVDLGDAMAGELARKYRLASDEKLSANLQQIANRLLKHMPPMDLQLRFFLVDLGEANAFNLPGGRIYISPKIVALAQNEDEIAGVLAHELGHLAAHQSAIQMTHDLADVLKVTQVSDRRDIFDKYHRYLENSWRKQSASARSMKAAEEREIVADRLALYAIAGAGYSVTAFADMYDRTAGTEMKTGNWFSDLMGSTTSESKRLREMIRTSSAIPPGCIEQTPKGGGDAFKTWQAAVVDYSGWSGQEVLHDVLMKTKLVPPLRGEVRRLRFSPDGKYILAQDEGNIFVLTRQPFAPLFQIDAPEAASAQFSPDSTQVVFHNGSLRVEVWNIANQKRALVREVIDRRGCLQSNLSPDGRLLACLEEKDGEYMRNADLVLFDTQTGKEVFRKPSFDQNWEDPILGILVAALTHPETLGAIDRGYFEAAFTPDARFLLAGHGGKNLLVDLSSRQEVSIPRRLGGHLTSSFAFLDDRRLIALNEQNPIKSHVLAFPSGEVQSEVSLGQGDVEAATHGDLVMIRPVKDFPVGVVDLKVQKNLFAYKFSALDAYDGVFVGEMHDGELGLIDVQTRRELTRAALPGGHLGALKAAAVSPDWKWLAASEEGRGAVWDLGNGGRLYHVRGFHGVYFANSYVLYADFPKYEKTERNISQLSLVHPQISMKPDLKDDSAQEYGKFLVVTKTPDKPRGGRGRENVAIETRDITTDLALWSRTFAKDGPSVAADSDEQRLLLSWPSTSAQAKVELQNYPAVQEKLDGIKEKEDYRLVEVLDLPTGKVLGALIAEAASTSFWGVFTLYAELDAHSSGDWIAVTGEHNEVVIYSLSGGNEVARYFGHRPVMSAASGLLCLENEPGHLTVYDLKSGEDLDRWVFSSPVSMSEFSSDGKRLFVLSADQTAYVLDVSLSVRPSAVGSLKP